MLQHIRERFTGVFAVVLLGMLGVSFVFFGIGNFTFLGGDFAAKVEDIEISALQLENAYQNELLGYPDIAAIPAEMRRSIKAQTLESLIRDVLMELHIVDKGYRVGDEQVAEIIQSAGQFQEDGAFKLELYESWLEQNVQDPRVFEEQQRRGFRSSQLQRGIGATSFVTPSEYRRYINLLAEEREVSLAVFDVAALADTIVVNDEDVQAYYDDRPDDFMAPESVDFEYLEVNREQIAEDIEIAEDVLRQYYDTNSGRFLQDEQRQARHILLAFGDDEIATEDEATALAARVNAGEPFEDLARQYSADGGTSERGGDLGPVMQSQMPGPLGDSIFSMSPGDVLTVRSDFGFHVVRLDQVIPGGPLPLDQVQSELLRELRADGVEAEARRLERQLSDALFDATELQSVASDAGLEVQTASGFTRAGGAPFGANQSVIDAVFDPRVANDGQISDLIEIDANRSIMVRVSEYNEESRRELADVKDEIVFAIQSSRALNIIEDRSRRLVEALQAGENFEDIAFQLEAQFLPSLKVSRTTSELDGAILDAIFRANRPSPGLARLGSTVSATGDYAVFTVNQVIPGKPEDIPLADRDLRKEQLQNVAGATDLNAFVNELQRTATIERNDAVLGESSFLQ